MLRHTRPRHNEKLQQHIDLQGSTPLSETFLRVLRSGVKGQLYRSNPESPSNFCGSGLVPRRGH